MIELQGLRARSLFLRGPRTEGITSDLMLLSIVLDPTIIASPLKRKSRSLF